MNTSNSSKDSNFINLCDNIESKVEELLTLLEQAYRLKGESDSEEELSGRIGDRLNESIGFDILRGAYLISRPILREKGLSVAGAMFRMNDDALWQLSEQTDTALSVARKLKNDSFDDERDREYSARQLKRHADRLNDALLEEYGQRAIGYRREIKRLTKED